MTQTATQGTAACCILPPPCGGEVVAGVGG